MPSAPPAGNKFVNWNKKNDEAKQLIKLFQEFDRDPSKGINYDKYQGRSEITQEIWSKFPFLHIFNPDYFWKHFQTLRAKYKLDKNLQRPLPTKPSAVGTARLSSK